MYIDRRLLAAAGLGAAVIALIAVLLLTGLGAADDEQATASGPTGATPGRTPDPEATATPASPTAPGVTLPAEASASPGPAEAASPESQQFYEELLAARDLVLAATPVHADVTGDGQPEVLLNAHAGECASCHARSLLVMQGPDVLFEDEGEGWFDLQTDGGGFEWVSPLRLPAEPSCCPSWFFVSTYQWEGSQFQAADRVQLRHFAEVNDQPIAGPLEPPVQLATVVLHYTLIDRQRYAQAYELLSRDFQMQNAFGAWSAGFSSTESVYVQAAELDPAGSAVSFTIEAVDSTAGGATQTATYEGAWTLVEEDGDWKLDAATIAPVSP